MRSTELCNTFVSCPIARIKHFFSNVLSFPRCQHATQCFRCLCYEYRIYYAVISYHSSPNNLLFGSSVVSDHRDIAASPFSFQALVNLYTDFPSTPPGSSPSLGKSHKRGSSSSPQRQQQRSTRARAFTCHAARHRRRGPFSTLVVFPQQPSRSIQITDIIRSP